MPARMELAYAKDAVFGFLDEDDSRLEMDPLEPGQKAVAITSLDGEGITLIGTPAELRDYTYRLYQWLVRRAG